jgi:hypothetical protein
MFWGIALRARKTESKEGALAPYKSVAPNCFGVAGYSASRNFIFVSLRLAPLVGRRAQKLLSRYFPCYHDRKESPR